MLSTWTEIHQVSLMCWCNAFMFHMTYFKKKEKKVQPLWAIKMSESNCEGGWTSYHKIKANEKMSHKFLKPPVKTRSGGWAKLSLKQCCVSRGHWNPLASCCFHLVLGAWTFVKINQDLDKPGEVNLELEYCASIWGKILAFLIKDGTGLYLTAKAQCFEVQIWIAYYTQRSERSYHVGHSDPLCDISQGDEIREGNFRGWNWSMFRKQHGLKTKQQC